MTDELIVGLLLYGVFPLWVAAGCVDYCCHRSTRIEHTTGRVESSLHVVQYLQIVVGLALGLFLEVTTLVLVLLVALAALHLATGYVDIAYTTGRRYISPPEQHVHSYMKVLPLVGAALVVVLYWQRFAAIFNDDAGGWMFAVRARGLPAGTIAAVAIGIGLAGLAIAEEYVRCARRGRHPRD